MKGNVYIANWLFLVSWLCYPAKSYAQPGNDSADWGYGSGRRNDKNVSETMGKPTNARAEDLKELRATAAPPLPNLKPNTIAGSPLNRARTVPKALSKNDRVINQWLDLFAFVSLPPLTVDKLNKSRLALKELIVLPEGNALLTIDAFWPLLQKECKIDPEQKENFKALLRALLRLTAHSAEKQTQLAGLINDILGPEKIIVPGSPQLTEEATDAFADMACFLYAYKHPGKSIDAVDNRVIFASVIAKKFNEAPSPADKWSVANFALKWSKFKILYQTAGETEKKALIQRMDGTASPNVQIDITNPVLNAVLSHGPWVEAMQRAIPL